MLRCDGQVVRPIFGYSPSMEKPTGPSPPEEPPPSRRYRIIKGVMKVLIVLFSLAWLLLGGTMAMSEKSEGWVFANAGAAVLVIVVALAARTTWSGVLMFACIALGFASCAANFHLNMR